MKEALVHGVKDVAESSFWTAHIVGIALVFVALALIVFSKREA